MAATLLIAAFSLLFGKLSSMFSKEVPNFWWQNSHYFTEQAVNENVLLVSILWLHNLKKRGLVFVRPGCRTRESRTTHLPDAHAPVDLPDSKLGSEA